MIEIRKPDARLKKLLRSETPRPNINYVPSRYAIPFAHKGKNYVFQNLTKQCIEGMLPASAQAGEGFDELIAARFLVPEDMDECAFYTQISALMRTFNRKKGIQGYTILPTLGCNARCVYCYEEGMKPASMTPETAEQVIRFILDTHWGDQVELAWFGGEPLLGEKTIDRVCAGLRDAGLHYKSSMTSNGSLITPEIVRKMAGDWKINSIQISMDGAEQDYLSRKRYISDSDNYHRVMDAVSQMSEAGIRVNIRCNVDEENWPRIPAFLDDLKACVANKDKVTVYFVPLNEVRRGENDVPMWEKIRDSRHLIEEAGFQSIPFLGLFLGFRVNHCMADDGSVVITPDGGLYPCEQCSAESRYGDIWHGTTDESTKQEFCRMDRIREKCRACPFLPDCTGFASCPIQDTHCREVHSLLALDALGRMVERRESENTDGENPIC